ncbi:MAG: hypothetical protein M1837_006953 [Sclerophora amabilis]|nr:MAG: hypothetical protein M1837_006953 [Sclerophora amabilis]
MAATSIDAFTLIVPNPDYVKDAEDLGPLPGNISYTLHLDNTLQTLSTNTVSRGDEVKGLLYVPDLDTNDSCVNASRPYVPANVTRRADLPLKDYNLIAFAPWTSADCTLSYLASASTAPTQAFIFYPTDHGRARPPPVSDPMWSLDDGGQWKSSNDYPVYAISGSNGDELMRFLSHYSGDMAKVDYGHELTQQHDPRDYARLFASISTGTAFTLPSLWVFLLIVLGALLLIVGFTSSLMHYIQHRRRQSLRRRVASGEVDLEALGIKRLTVSKNRLDGMPMFIYVADDPSSKRRSSLPLAPAAAASLTSRNEKPVKSLTSQISLVLSSSKSNVVPLTRSPSPETMQPPPNQTSSGLASFLPPSPPLPPSPAPPAQSETKRGKPPPDLPHRSIPYCQPTCPICIEDFVTHQTVVRELPCGHVFDPECIDDFLLKRSSLCPICKKSVLPQGYCPERITNAMVRRERMVRRMRARLVLEDTAGANHSYISPTTLAVSRGMASFQRQIGSLGRAPGNGGWRRTVSAPLPGTVEMRETADPSNPLALPSSTSRSRLPGRRDWGRGRASEMIGRELTVEEEEREMQGRLPRWRKVFRFVFPGFH